MIKITIDDGAGPAETLTLSAEQEAGTKEALANANASLPEERNEKGDVIPLEDRSGYLARPAEYLARVMSSATESYAKMYGMHEATLVAEEVSVAAKRAKLEATK